MNIFFYKKDNSGFNGSCDTYNSDNSDGNNDADMTFFRRTAEFRRFLYHSWILNCLIYLPAKSIFLYH